jgi:hypothetical protein
MFYPNTKRKAHNAFLKGLTILAEVIKHLFVEATVFAFRKKAYINPFRLARRLPGLGEAGQG